MNHYFDIDNRTAGAFNGEPQIRSIQSWKTKGQRAQAVQQIEQRFEEVLNDTSRMKNVNSFADTNQQTDLRPKTSAFHSYEETRTAIPKHKPAQTADSFKFGDVIDIINPLQHLPVIGYLYRGLTGDEIKPASQIIGGGLFGGPIGAVSGTVNAVSQIKTGKDIASNVLSVTRLPMMGFSEQDPTVTKLANLPSELTDTPEERLDYIASGFGCASEAPKLPGTALAFANLSEVGRGYINASQADGRTAGSHIVKKNVAFRSYEQASQWGAVDIEPVDLDTDMPRFEKITSLSLSAMPPRQKIFRRAH